MTVVCPPKFDTAHSQSLKNRAMTSPTLHPRKEGGKNSLTIINLALQDFVEMWYADILWLLGGRRMGEIFFR